MKNILLFFATILCLCGWNYPNDWGTGVINPPGIIYTIQTATTNVTQTAYQTGNTLIMLPTSNDTTVTLPSATVPGYEYTIIDDTATWISVHPASTADTIQLAGETAGTGIKNSTSTAIGNSISLICRQQGIWSIETQSGTWTVGN